MRVMLAARQGAVVARTKAIGQLKALIVNAPEALRDQLRACLGRSNADSRS